MSAEQPKTVLFHPRAWALHAALFAIVMSASSAHAVVSLFGAKTYEMAPKQRLQVTERFGADGPCDTPAAVYTLTLAHGASGAGRLKDAKLTLNGTVVATLAEADANGRIEKSVALSVANELALDLTGDEKLPSSVTVGITRRITAPVMHERTFELAADKSGTFEHTFTETDPTGAFSIVVTNGTREKLPMDDASIVLNGVEVIGRKDLAHAGMSPVVGTVYAVSRPVTLAASNQLRLELRTNTTPASMAVKIVRHISDTTAPILSITSPADGLLTNNPALTVSGTAIDPFGVDSVSVNGAPAVLASNGSFTTGVTLAEGINTLAVRSVDCEANASDESISVRLDTVPPQLTVTSPAAGAFIASHTVLLRGTLTDDVAIGTVTVDGVAAAMNAGEWTASRTFPADGQQTIALVATDLAGNVQTLSLPIVVDTTPPSIEGSVAPDANPAGWLAADATVTFACSDSLSGIAACPEPILVTTDGSHDVTAEAIDRAGNRATATLLVKVDKTPPDIYGDITPSVTPAGWVPGDAEVHFRCRDAASGVATCPEPIRVSTEGRGQMVTAQATDTAGNTDSRSVLVNIDRTEPRLQLDAIPSEPLRTSSYELTGTAEDALSGISLVLCNSVAATIEGSRFTCTVPLMAGSNTIRVVAFDDAGHEVHATASARHDGEGPQIRIAEPKNGTRVVTDMVRVDGGALDDEALASVTVNGTAVELDTDGNFVIDVPLAVGPQTIAVAAADTAGNITTRDIAVERVVAPSVSIDTPEDLLVLRDAAITVRGTVTDSAATVVVNETTATVSGNSFVAHNVPLWQGRTVITAVATNAAGLAASTTVNIYRDSIPPRLTVRYPKDGAVVHSPTVAVSGTVDDIVVGTINAGQMRVTVNGIEAEVANRAFLVPDVPLSAGENTLLITAIDEGGNRAVTSYRVTHAPNPDGARLIVVSGNTQHAKINTRLPKPVVVRATGAGNVPLPNRSLTFRITDNNGTVTAGGRTDRSVNVLTNAAGEASVEWTLGSRAGAGNNRLEVKGDGLGVAELQATATYGTPHMIVVDSGGSQLGAVDDALPRPLVAIVTDAGSNRLANIPVQFTVHTGGGSFDGVDSIIVHTDSDGRAIARPILGLLAGEDNNAFVASVDGLADSAIFFASGRVPGAAADTRIRGVVLDNSNVPIEGVSIRIEGTSIVEQTDAEGQFLVEDAPVGYAKLIVDGSTAQRNGTWPMIEYVVHPVAGIDNDLGMPLYLLPIDTGRGVYVDETRGATLTLPELPGFSLTVAPGSATFPGGSRSGTVSVTLVHSDKVPMTPTFGQQPRFIVTIQPPGAHFDPPAQITFANVEGLAPGEVTEMYSFDHDLGQYVTIGTGSASEDGSVVRSDPGAGIIKGGWHFTGGDPQPDGTPEDCGECQLARVHVLGGMRMQSCAVDPEKVSRGCDDGKVCTENDKCDGAGKCAGEKKPSETLAKNDLNISLKDAIEPVAAFVKRLVGDDEEFGKSLSTALRFTYSEGRTKACCEGGNGVPAGAYLISETYTGSAASAISMKDRGFPGAYLELPYVGKIGLFLNARLSATFGLTGKKDACDQDKLKGEASVRVVLNLGVKAGAIDESKQILSISIAGSTGLTAGCKTADLKQMQCQLGHNGLTVIGAVQLLGGMIEYSKTATLIEPEAAPPWQVPIPWFN